MNRDTEKRIVDLVIKPVDRKWGAGISIIGTEVRRSLYLAEALRVVGRQCIDGRPVESKAATADALVQWATDVQAFLDEMLGDER